MTYLKERTLSTRVLSLFMSFMMVFSMFSTLTGIAAPIASAVSATPDGYTSADISWDAVPGALGYYVYRSTSQNGNYEQIANVESGTQYKDTGLTAGATYYYRVQPYSEQAVTYEIFTIRAEHYGQGSDDTYVYENTNGNLYFKKYGGSAPTKEANPEAYWYQEGQYIRNYGSGKYVALGTDTVPAGSSASGTYGTEPNNAYVTATAQNNNNFKWTIHSVTCNSTASESPKNTTKVISLASNNQKQWANGRQRQDNGQLAVARISSTDMSGSCGRHWKIENQSNVQGDVAIVGGTMSDVISVTMPEPTPELSITGYTQNSVSLSWSYEGTASKYEIHRSVDGGEYSKLAETTATSYVDETVEAGKTYSYKVAVQKSGATSGGGSATCDIISLAFFDGNTKNIYDNNGAVSTTTASNTTTQWYKIPAGENAYGQQTYYLKNVSTDRYMYVPDNRLGNNGDWYYYKTLTATTNAQTDAYKWVIMNNPGRTDWQIVINNRNYDGATTVTGLNGHAYILTNFNQTNPGLYSDSAAPAVNCGLTTDVGGNVWHTSKETTVQANVANPDGSAEAVLGEFSNVVNQPISSAIDAPTNLQANANGYTAINLTWNAVDGATSYIVYRADEETGAYGQIATPNTNSFVDTGLTAGKTYYYKVSATDGTNTSYVTDVAYATTDFVDTPQNLVATADGSSKINLSWNAVAIADRYEIYRSTVLEQSSFAKIDETTSTTFADTGLAEETTYYYVVIAVDEEIQSEYSNVASATTTEAIPELRITNYSTAQIDLAWDYTGQTSEYVIYRSADGVSYSELARTANTTYNDTDIAVGNVYYYKVSPTVVAQETITVGGMDYTDKSSIDSFTQDTLQSDDRYNAGFIGNDAWAKYEINAAYAGNYNVDLYMAADAATLTGYLNDESNKTTPLVAVENQASNNGWQNYKAYSSTITLNKGINTIYFVAGSSLNLWKMEFSIDVNEEGTASNVVSQPISSNVATPENLVAVQSGYDKIDLSWNAVEEATAYNIYKGESENGVYALLTSTEETTYTDSNLTSGKTYYYYIVATDGTDLSAPSAKANATTKTLGVPSAFTSTTTTPTNSIRVSWYGVTDATGYNVYRSTGGNSTYSLIAENVQAPYVATGLVAGTTYFFRVQAIAGENIVSSLSTPVYATTSTFSAPTPMVTGTTASSITISWADVNYATGYTVYRSDAQNGAYQVISSNATSPYTDLGLTEETTYYYKVESTDGTNNASSEGISGTTTGKFFLGDKYNREDLFDFDVSTAITNISAKGASITDGVLKLTDSAETPAFLSEGFEIGYNDNYSYLVLKVKGENGGEDERMSFTNAYYYGDPERSAFSNLKTYGGDSVPSITTNWQYIVVDIEESGLQYEKDTVGETNNFSFTLHLDQSDALDTVYIDEIFLTNDVIIPTNLQANAGSVDKVTLSWTAPTEATTYNVYRSTNGSNYIQVASDVTETSYIDNAVSQNTTYYYHVTAKYNLTETSPSNVATATTETVDASYLTVLSVADKTVREGESFTAEAVIKNTGGVDQTESYTVSFDFNGTVKSVIVTDDLAVGQTKTVTETFTAPTEGDSADLTVSLENSEQATATVTITRPEIAVTAVPDISATAGQQFTATAIVSNSGQADQLAEFNVIFVFNNGGEVTVSTDVDVPASSFAEVETTFTAPMLNGEYPISAKLAGQTAVNGKVTVTGGDDEEPYTENPPTPITVPDFTEDYATFVAGPFFIKNDYEGFGYQYLYDTTENNSYAGAEDGQNGADSTAYANYGRALRSITNSDILTTIADNQNYMWNIYSYTVGGNTYYMIRNVGTGRYMHTGAYGDYISEFNDNNSLNMFAWNQTNVNGATGLNANSNANRELSYYMYSFKAAAVDGTSTASQADVTPSADGFTAQIMNQRFAWGQRPLHGQIQGNLNTTERNGRVFFTSNNYGWGTKSWDFLKANVAVEAANLKISNVTVNPTTMLYGSSFEATATVANDGNKDAVGTVQNPILIKFGFNGIYRVAEYVGTIAAGESVNIEQQITPNKVAVTGATLNVTANADWAIGETDYTDNYYAVENIIVSDDSTPVLEVTTVEDVTVAYKESFTATAIITNIGRATQTDSYTVSFTFNGETKNVIVTDILEADGTKTVTTTFDAPAVGGVYPITVSIGTGNKSGNVTVQVPSLEITEVTPPAEAVNAGTAYQISAVVTNNGEAAFTDDSYDVTFTVNGVNVVISVNETLAIGDSKTVTADFTAPAINDTYDVTVAVADSTDTSESVTVIGGDDKDIDPVTPPQATPDETYYLIRSVQRGAYLLDSGTQTNVNGDGNFYRIYWDTDNTSTAAADNRYLWVREDAGSGRYYIKNVATGRYIETTGVDYYGYIDNAYNTNCVRLVENRSNDDSTAFTMTSVNTGTRDEYSYTTYTLHDVNMYNTYGYYLNTHYTGGGNVITSSTYSNNNSRNFEFLESSVSPADITVTDVEVSSKAINYNGEFESFTATATITNEGGTAVPANTPIKVKFAFNGRIVTVNYTGGLAVGATDTVEATITPNKLTDGASLVVTANSDYEIEESDYSNNSFTVEDISVKETISASFKVVVKQRTFDYTAFRQFVDIYTDADDSTALQLVRFKGLYNTYNELVEAYNDEYAANGNSFIGNDAWTATGTTQDLFDAYRNYDILNVQNRLWGDEAKTAEENNVTYTECGYFSAIDTEEIGQADYTLLAYDPASGEYVVVPVTAVNFDYVKPTVNAVVVNDAALGELLHITVTSGPSGIQKVSYKDSWGGNAFSYPNVLADYDEAVAQEYLANGLSNAVLGYDLDSDNARFEAYVKVDTSNIESEYESYYAVGVMSGTLTNNTNIKVFSGFKMSVSCYTNLSRYTHETLGESARYLFASFRVTSGNAVAKQIFDATELSVNERAQINTLSDCWNTAETCKSGDLYIDKNGYYIFRVEDSEGLYHLYTLDLTKSGVTHTAPSGIDGYTNYSLTLDSTAPQFYTEPVVYVDTQTNQKYAEVYIYDMGAIKAVSYDYGINHPAAVYSNIAFADANSGYTVTEDNGAIVENVAADTLPVIAQAYTDYQSLDYKRVRIPLLEDKNIMISVLDASGRVTHRNIPIMSYSEFSVSFNKVSYHEQYTDVTGKTWYNSMLLNFKYTNGTAATKQVIDATELTELEVSAILDGTNQDIWNSQAAQPVNGTFYFANRNHLAIFKVTTTDGRSCIFAEDINYIDGKGPEISAVKYEVVGDEFYGEFMISDDTAVTTASLSQTLWGTYKQIPNSVFLATDESGIEVSNMYQEGNEIITFVEDETVPVINRYNAETGKYETIIRVKLQNNRFINFSATDSMSRYTNFTLTTADVIAAYNDAVTERTTD